MFLKRCRWYRKTVKTCNGVLTLCEILGGQPVAGARGQQRLPQLGRGRNDVPRGGQHGLRGSRAVRRKQHAQQLLSCARLPRVALGGAGEALVLAIPGGYARELRERGRGEDGAGSGAGQVQQGRQREAALRGGRARRRGERLQDAGLGRAGGGYQHDEEAPEVSITTNRCHRVDLQILFPAVNY